MNPLSAPEALSGGMLSQRIENGLRALRHALLQHSNSRRCPSELSFFRVNANDSSVCMIRRVVEKFRECPDRRYVIGFFLRVDTAIACPDNQGASREQ
jgi:hypothetical protein